MDSDVNIHDIYCRISETAVWCDMHVMSADPESCLYTPELRPANLSSVTNRWGTSDYNWQSAEQVCLSIDKLANRRAELLHTRGIVVDEGVPDVRRGRLLVAFPHESDSSGLSAGETNGFIDVDDVAPWDTWVGYFQEHTQPEEEYVQKKQSLFRNQFGKSSGFVDWQPPTTVSYLLCWIPELLVALVEEGIRVNPTDCFFWAADYRRNHCNTSTLRQLKVAGWLQ